MGHPSFVLLGAQTKAPDNKYHYLYPDGVIPSAGTASGAGIVDAASGPGGSASGGSGSTYDYYISPTGSDSNPGTLAAPFAITSLLSSQSSNHTTQSGTNRSLIAGKRVLVMAGTYHVAQHAAGINDADHVVLDIPSGTSTNPTIIEGELSGTSRVSIIEGTDSGGTNRVNTYYSNGCGIIGQTYLTSGGGYVQLKNLTIRKGYRYLVHFRYAGAIQDGPRKSGIVVDGCDLNDIHNNGFGVGDNISLIQAYCTDGMIVRGCVITNARGDTTAGDANGYGIQTWSCNNHLFEFNTITNCKDGIYVKNLYQTGHVVRNNYIDLTAYDGAGVTNALNGFEFSTSGVQQLAAYNNILVAGNGLRTHDLGTTVDGPVQFYNNTVVAITAFSVVGIQCYSVAQPFSCYNNIVYHTGSSSEEGDLTLSVGNTGVVDYNCYPASPKLCSANGSNNYPDNSYSTVAAYYAARGFDQHSIATNPLFAATGSNADYYQLGGSSPCLNAGHVGGVSGGATRHMGAWDGVVTQIGAAR